MINRMRGSKTGAYRAIFHQKSYTPREVRIMTWTNPHEITFYQCAAYVIAKCYIKQKKIKPITIPFL